MVASVHPVVKGCLRHIGIVGQVQPLCNRLSGEHHTETALRVLRRAVIPNLCPVAVPLADMGFEMLAI